VAEVGVEGFLPGAGTPIDLLPFALALARGERRFPDPWPSTPQDGVRRILTRLLGR
jgi:hypothetical protein